MNGWMLRALVEDLTDEELRAHVAWAARMLADRRRAAGASDADELPRRLELDAPFAERDTDPGGLG